MRLQNTLNILADRSIRAERIGICQSCDYYNSQKDKCVKCGCGVKAKIMFCRSKCPLKKW